MAHNEQDNRRDFLKKMAAVTGGVVLAPMVVACTGGSQGGKAAGGTTPAKKDIKGAAGEPKADGMGYAGPVKTSVAVPQDKPSDWDAVAFNKKRGNAGAIPKSYLGSINGPDGDKKHLGKHLPFIPTLGEGNAVPAGHVAIMWGDPSKGYAQHPNAEKDISKKYIGHWYNWIRVRKAVAGEAEEAQSTFADWPGTGEEAKKYVAKGGGDIKADKGKSTVYLVALPKDVKKGDTVRIWAHCLTHGEFVDFITV
jgi:hypothetical protein